MISILRADPPECSRTVGCRWTAAPDGAGALSVIYRGPLSVRDAVFVRFGVTRAGRRPWTEVRELRLRREDAIGCVATLDIPSGEPVTAIQLAFRAGVDWDNGGAGALGYYEWRPGDGKVRVHG